MPAENRRHRSQSGGTTEYTVRLPHFKNIYIPKDNNILGAGSFGVVRFARHDVLGDIAVKVLELCGSAAQISENKRRIQKEMESFWLACQRSQFVLQMYGVTKWGRYFGIVMEFLQGGTLHKLILQNTDIEICLPLLLRMVFEIANGLTTLHNLRDSERITHNDLKPSNILLTTDLHCKIGDFGGARLATATNNNITRAFTNRAGEPVEYTYEYADPERLDAVNIEIRTYMDVYSFAMVVYTMITRKRPKPSGVSRDEYKHFVKNGNRPSLESVQGSQEELMLLLKRVVESCWHTDVSERPTMKDIRNEIRNVLHAQSPCVIGRGVVQVLEKYPIDPNPGNSSNIEWHSLSGRRPTVNDGTGSDEPFVAQAQDDIFNSNQPEVERSEECALSSLLVIGGKSTGGATKKLNVCENTRNWVNQQDLPDETWSGCAARIRDRTYFFGGLQDEEAVASCLSINLQQNGGGEWELMPDMNEKRASFASAVMNDRIFVTGGMNGNPSKCGEVFDGSRWLPLATQQCMKVARRMHGMLSHNGSFYAFGGWNGQERLETIERFDPRENIGWQILPFVKLNCRKSSFALVSLDDQAFIIGGYNGITLHETEAIDLRSYQRTYLGNMQLSRQRSAAGTLRGKIYICGGEGADGCENTVEEFDQASNSWNILCNTYLNDDQFQPLSGHCIVEI